MATTAEAQQRVLSALDTIELMLGDLPQMAREWERLTEGERASWSIDWSNEMSKLQRLAESVSNGHLPAAQRARYDRLLERLKESIHTLPRLDLYCPPALHNTFL